METPTSKTFLVDAVDPNGNQALTAEPIVAEYDEAHHRYVARHPKLGEGKPAHIAEAAVGRLLTANDLSLRGIKVKP